MFAILRTTLGFCLPTNRSHIMTYYEFWTVIDHYQILQLIQSWFG